MHLTSAGDGNALWPACCLLRIHLRCPHHDSTSICKSTNVAWVVTQRVGELQMPHPRCWVKRQGSSGMIWDGCNDALTHACSMHAISQLTESTARVVLHAFSAMHFGIRSLSR